MPKIYLSDKQLPAIPADSVLNELLELTKRATPGARNLVDIGGQLAACNWQLRTVQGDLPLGRHDAELAAILSPELVRGLLYKIALLEDARDDAVRLAQDALGDKITPQQAAKLTKLLAMGAP